MPDTSSSMEKPEFEAGTDIFGWKVVCFLGSGGFGAVYEVQRGDGAERAALKAEFAIKKSEALHMEAAVLRLVQWSPYFCHLYTSGYVEKLESNVMIMSLLGLPLSKIRRKCPDSTLTGSSAMRVAMQTLQAIEHLHSVGVVHRDIKCHNFAWSDQKRHMVLFDFGCSRRFLALNKNGKAYLRPERREINFVGTSKYCSVKAHQREDLSRMDDLWCWMYMTVELLKGHLVWSNHDTDCVATIKIRAGESLVKNCPPEMKVIYQHVSALTFFAKPNYNFLMNALSAYFIRKDVSSSDPFDWEIGGAHYEYFCESSSSNSSITTTCAEEDTMNLGSLGRETS